MAQPQSVSGSKKEPTLFEILALTPNSLDGQDPPTQSKTVKQAYRRALLKHHPDKNQQVKAQNAPADPQDASSSKSSGKEEVHYTVDQITHAYTVLGDTRQRREYSRSLKIQARTAHISTCTATTSTSGSRNGGGKQTAQDSYTTTFQTGVETVDLDDLAWDSARQVYHRSCRCGSARGYCFRELDLEEVGEEGELMVQCVGCSLWLRVLFTEAVDSDEDSGEDEGAHDGTEVKQSKSDDWSPQRTRSMEGKKGGWSWKINFGISIGGGVSASAKAGRGG